MRPTNEIVARASPSPQNDPPPVPSKYTKGEVFYYDGYQKTSSKFKQFEDMWKQLVDLLNLVDKPDPNDIFELWFNPQYLLEVQHVFGFMWQAVDPNASPPAPKDSPKIWIMSNDYAKQCSGLQGTLAYTQPFSKLSESELSSVVSRSAMGKDDCIIHFCEELMDYYLQHQWTECSQIQPRQVTERLAANLLETLLHELM
ncbi:hypothetical protein NUU61_004989 [Penicillium alfredii]|uniref:Uncharacterized protein n=1 Tax=Penicillium alfredii TaxID=1506179 RepID=A0A9W9F8P9_9EURO|nr:uncharacterized protein NUU61_004989 [Penicillium alfredii]KAJ5095633.1 hypothetical protein NUU61_004989 [Penicillium alfredii]